MSRLSIEISREQHQHIKAMAAIQGQSIKDFVMGRLFPTDQDEEQAWRELKALLLDRIEQAQSGRLSNKTIQDIANEALAKKKQWMSSYILTEGAEEDWAGIVEYTLDHFGERQLVKYTSKLAAYIEKLAKGEDSFKDIKVDYFVVRLKRCQKHYVFASVIIGQPLIILAILHERMDWMQRLKDRLTKE